MLIIAAAAAMINVAFFLPYIILKWASFCFAHMKGSKGDLQAILTGGGAI